MGMPPMRSIFRTLSMSLSEMLSPAHAIAAAVSSVAGEVTSCTTAARQRSNNVNDNTRGEGGTNETEGEE